MSKDESVDYLLKTIFFPPEADPPSTEKICSWGLSTAALVVNLGNVANVQSEKEKTQKDPRLLKKNALSWRQKSFEPSQTER